MKDNTAERWLPVVGYEGWYEVSDWGRVRSLPRTAGVVRKLNLKGKLLSLTTWDGLYWNVPLSRNGEMVRVRVHVLVCQAFRGARPDGQVIRHLDGDGFNNHLSNLVYGSQAENIRDTISHGTNYHGSRSECSRGHEYTDANTRLRLRAGRISRVCRQCKNEAARELWSRRRDVIPPEPQPE